MASTVQLIRGDDDGRTANLLSLYNYEEGLAVHDWTQATPSAGGPTIETLGLRVRGTSTNNVAAILQLVDKKIREANQYFNANDLFQVWLRVRVDGESYYRKALVLNMQAAPGRSMMDYVFHNTKQLNEYTLAIERMPYWEDTESAEIVLTQRPQYAFDLGTTIGGDVPARIRHVIVSGWQDYYWSEVWIGFRTDRFGSRTGFTPNIALTNALAREDTTIVGSTATVAFVTETLAERVYVRMDNVDGTEANYRGEFQVLIEASVGATTVCNLRLKHGFYTDATNNTWIAHDNRVQVTGTSNELYDLGVVRFPFTRGTGADAFMRGHALCIEAERISGTNDLTLGDIILIPRSEGFLYLKAGAPSTSPYTQGTITSSNVATVYTHPEGRIEGNWYNDGTPEKTLELSKADWSLPVGDSRVICAANSQTAIGGHSSGDQINMRFRYFQRWRTLKGAG